MIVLSGLSFLLAAVQAEPQLIGHRGVFTLREGQVSVDHDTSDPHPIFAGVQGRGDREVLWCRVNIGTPVRASEAAARFALLTERDEQILHRSRKFDSQ